MDIKQSWGCASIILGMMSLLWGCISLAGMMGQEQVFSNMDAFRHIADSHVMHYGMDETVAAARYKNFIVLLTGMVMSVIGAMMMKGSFNR